MKAELSDKVIGYHYTNPIAYSKMEENKEGLIPYHTFVRPCDHVSGLPSKAYEFVTEGLLEQEPDSWVKNQEFPVLVYSSLLPF